MPIFEFRCPTHGKFERIIDAKYDTQPCPAIVVDEESSVHEAECRIESDKVEFSVPAKRNPEHGVQK